jgi:hypothetical protein
MGASEADPADRVSGAALSPCSDTGVRAGGSRPGVEGGTLPLVVIRRELRALTQEITPLIGFLADLSDERRLVEWAWYFDELGEKVAHVQSHAMLLKHECAVMWERVYALGRDEEA